MCAAIIRIDNVSLGKVISLNGQKFAKVSNDPSKGSRFVALKRACPAGIFNGYDMQEFTIADCDCLVTPTAKNYTLAGVMKDSRDNKLYEVRKFADGQCWMVDNLAYGGVADACVSKTAFAGSSNLSGSAWGYGDCRNNPGFAGYLYNWQAAMQHPSVYYGSNYQPTEPTQGICPFGWHIPSGNTSGEYQALHMVAGLPATGFWQGGSWKGTYAGICDIAGNLFYQGATGMFWSSTYGDTTVAYNLYLDSSAMTAAHYNYKHNGLPVRCIKN